MNDIRHLEADSEPNRRSSGVSLVIRAAWILALGCGSSTPKGDAATNGATDSSDANLGSARLVISAATPVPRTTTWSVNYWQWMPDYGDQVTGTESLIAALKPAFLRVGGHNNDANVADPFDNPAFDKAVVYARAVGAEPIIQIPLLAGIDGQPPTAATAAAMVHYANITRGWAIKYFSIGNEPDLYATQGLPASGQLPAIPGYRPSDYCASVTAYVAAMKAEDPSIRIVGPDLSWKYQAGNGGNDWLTPILTECGNAFDIISIHRYPFDAAHATLKAAAADPAALRRTIGLVRGILQNTGQGDKPLALTEMNIAYDETRCALDASPGTLGAALWLADSLGSAIDLGLWTNAVWDIGDSDSWGLGLIGMAPGHTPRPSYYAYALYADHFGPTVLDVLSAPGGISAHASRNAANDATEIIVVNWNSSATTVPVEVRGLVTMPPNASVLLPPLSVAAVEIPDDGPAETWTYGEAQRQASIGPQRQTADGPAAREAGAGTDGGAGRVAGAGCGAHDASIIATAEGGITTACDATIPQATGNLNVSGSYVTANSLHGYGSIWAWKGISSEATVCALPSCTTGDEFLFYPIDGYGVAPWSALPTSCVPALPTSALCAAGSMSKDPTYYSTVGVGFNLGQDQVDAGVGGIAIEESITVTTQLFGSGKGNSLLRLQLTDMDDNYYCVDTKMWKSGVAVPIGNFRKQCWDGSVPDAAAKPGTLARRLDIVLPGGLSDVDFSFCLLDLAAK